MQQPFGLSARPAAAERYEDDLIAVAIDKTGAFLIADAVGNTVWRG
jgi:hypothetical protein